MEKEFSRSRPEVTFVEQKLATIQSGHSIENSGITYAILLGMLKVDQSIDISLSQWARRVPQEAVTSYLNLNPEQIAKIPSEKELVS